MLCITNAFSINMLEGDSRVSFKQLELHEAVSLVQDWAWTSAVGHADTAAVFSGLLGVSVPMNRVTVKAEGGLLIGQMSGPRLPEGATKLPEGAEIQWWLVTVE